MKKKPRQIVSCIQRRSTMIEFRYNSPAAMLHQASSNLYHSHNALDLWGAKTTAWLIAEA